MAKKTFQYTKEAYLQIYTAKETFLYGKETFLYKKEAYLYVYTAKEVHPYGKRDLST